MATLYSMECELCLWQLLNLIKNTIKPKVLLDLTWIGAI